MSKTLADRTAEQKARVDAKRAYLIANGWPTKLDGSLQELHSLDLGTLRAMAGLWLIHLEDEFNSITTRKQEQARARRSEPMPARQLLNGEYSRT